MGVGRGALVGFGVGALVLMVALGRPQEKQYLDHRYEADVAPPLTGGFRASPQWIPVPTWGPSAKDSRIGVSGRASAFGQYFFYGSDLSNYVQYIGQNLRRGTFRPINTCRDWRKAINEGDYDYVVTTPRVGESEIFQPPENAWMRTEPNAKLFISSGPARVYQIIGRLDPATCAKLGDLAHT
jgi:hypothetical protein